MIWPWVIIIFLAVERLAELVYSERNTRALLARGAHEVGRGHYPLIVVFHVAWFVAVGAFLPRPAPIYPIPLLLLGVLQMLRYWVLKTLGPYWTTRIITLPGAPLVWRGPYRFLRHPNYMVVVGEIALLPLVFGEIWVAVAFSILHAGLIWWRIRTEDDALASRRHARG